MQGGLHAAFCSTLGCLCIYPVYIPPGDVGLRRACWCPCPSPQKRFYGRVIFEHSFLVLFKGTQKTDTTYFGGSRKLPPPSPSPILLALPCVKPIPSAPQLFRVFRRAGRRPVAALLGHSPLRLGARHGGAGRRGRHGLRAALPGPHRAAAAPRRHRQPAPGLVQPSP